MKVSSCHLGSDVFQSCDVLDSVISFRILLCDDEMSALAV